MKVGGNMYDWKELFNVITKQQKGLESKITPSEWNFIVNTLSIQSNNNTKGIKNLQTFIKRIEETGGVKEGEIKEIKDLIFLLQSSLIQKADLVEGKVPIEQLPDLIGADQIHIGASAPEDENIILWLKLE